jgi:DNA-3-methyladenine glycosylase II
MSSAGTSQAISHISVVTVNVTEQQASELVEHVGAAEELARRDPDLARAIATVGPLNIRPPLDSRFAALCRSIVFQQLAGRAAAAIYGRFVQAVGPELTAEAVLAAPQPALRTAGLSAAKTASLLDLAAKVVDGTVPLDGIQELTDDEIVARLSSVRGIGRWTAQMFLIFQLRRPDVWPVDDLGVRRGYAAMHRLAVWPKPKELELLGDVYRPWRSVTAWYCWRMADVVLPAS